MQKLETKKGHALRLAANRRERQASSEYKKDNKPPTGNGYSSIMDAERWALTQFKQLSSYTPERAKAILSDIPGLIALPDFIDKLKAIANPNLQTERSCLPLARQRER